MDPTETWFVMIVLRISRAAKNIVLRISRAPKKYSVKNLKGAKNILEKVSQKADKRSLVCRIRKHQANFFEHVIRRDKQEHLATTGMMEGKDSRVKHREMLDGQTQ